ncbi:MAG: SprT family zinc-dependent metalloprotease [Methylococcales bacterium]
MVTQIHLGEMAVDVVFKDIKNIHLSVYPPEGKVRISAPLRLNIDTIRVFAITKLAWIRQQQAKLRAQHRETPREYLNRESHYVWGKRYLLKVIELDALPKIELDHHQIQLHVRPATTQEQKQILIEHWYRETIKDAIQSLIMKWEPIMGVKVERFFVQRMKTRWGSCNPLAKSIRLNTDLAKKPPECLEYIVVHEMTHLLEPSHNQRFISLMDEFLPKWRFYKEALNNLPLRHESWVY